MNGKPYPHDNEFVLKQGGRYRWSFVTAPTMPIRCICIAISWSWWRSTASQPRAWSRTRWLVPYYGRVVVDFTADQPGLTLFHCHIQQHMDYGFKALFRYS